MFIKNSLILTRLSNQQKHEHLEEIIWKHIWHRHRHWNYQANLWAKAAHIARYEKRIKLFKINIFKINCNFFYKKIGKISVTVKSAPSNV